MGFRIASIGSRLLAEELVNALGLDVVDTSIDIPDRVWRAPRIRDAGWPALWSEDEEFGTHNAGTLQDLPEKSDVFACSVNETTMAATAIAYSGGNEIWRTDWRSDDGPKQENLTASGTLPVLFESEVERQSINQERDGEVDHLFEIPLNPAAARCGFRRDQFLQPEQIDKFLNSGRAKNERPKSKLLPRLFGGRS